MPFKFRGATISTNGLTIGDEEDLALMYPTIIGGGVFLTRHLFFCEFMLGAIIDGDPPVPMVTAMSTPDEIRASYAEWRKLPRTCVDPECQHRRQDHHPQQQSGGGCR